MRLEQARTIFLIVFATACSAAAAQTVKITPLGSHAGELCGRDRATIFEDPTGIRILYDAGQSVTGADDPRLGKIDVVILSHAHGDHIGDQKMKALEAGTCENPQLVSAAPNSTTAEIAAAKNAAIVMVVPLANFIGRKIETIRGKPTGACGQPEADIVAPVTAPCLATVQTGGTRTVKATATSKAVEITAVPAAHDSTVPITLLSEAQRKNVEPDNVSFALGPPSGYIIRFSNGLTAYLTGDTGVHAEMQTVAHDFYKANLVELNYGPSALTPEAAAYAVNVLVQPASVIISHVNEAATSGGKVRPTSRTAAFIALVKGRPVYPALSGKTMEFDGAGKCTAGC
ncbi:MAG TPA: MBL fold metallo-hydrolase [Casimicrobiaceae bacterium]|jgi:L-ascorbate metabolism protein UlaG (beta-lactamase superfamily)